MRKWIKALCLLLVLSCGCGLCEGGQPHQTSIDFSAYTLDELYILRGELEQAIAHLEAAQGDSTVYQSGVYQVGVDILPGVYVITETEHALFSNLVIYDSDGEDANILKYMLITNQDLVCLSANTWVTLSYASAYPISAAPAVHTDENGNFPEGGYWVGVHLEPGTYSLLPDNKAPISSYSIYDGIPGTNEQLLKFESFTAPVSITLSERQYLLLSGCSLVPNQE